eukprot:2510011-Rhodomonas_salina.2
MSGPNSAICLRVLYATSGTDLAYGTIGLRTCYVMSGTELAYGATRRLMKALEVGSAISLRERYAMPAIRLRELRY